MRQRNRAAVAAMTAAAALVLAGCSAGGSADTTGTAAGGHPKGGVLTMARSADIISMDKTTTFDNNSIHVMQQIMEPLFNVSAGRQEGRAVAGDRVRRLGRRARRTRSTSARASSSPTGTR